MTDEETPDYAAVLKLSGKTIYDPIEIGDPDFWIPTPDLSNLLNKQLIGLDTSGMPNRTRSKFVKSKVCEALGYPEPPSFRRTQPRFIGQQLDVYVQKSNNLQIWNEQLSPNRRYALFEVSKEDKVVCVKVVNGQQLSALDTTGTITTKFQARVDLGGNVCELVSGRDTAAIIPFLDANAHFDKSVSPTDEPKAGELLPITEIYARLCSVVGKIFPDPGASQERNRGAALHRLACQSLGYDIYGDTGQFPDIRHQLLEVKLQTSSTIDLGLVLPESSEHMDIRRLGDYQPQHRDARYAIFCGQTNGTELKITHVIVTTGADFFQRFKQFGGKIKNGKIQIRLPRDFFDC